MYAAPGCFRTFSRAASNSALVSTLVHNQSRQPMASGSLWYCQGASRSKFRILSGLLLL
jgi:hypothetical protein